MKRPSMEYAYFYKKCVSSDPCRQRSPVGPFIGKTIKPRIGLTPILRAGTGMTDALVGSLLLTRLV